MGGGGAGGGGGGEIRFTFISDQVEALLGYPVQHWLGDEFWPACAHRDDRDAVFDFYNRVLERGGGSRERFEIEYRARKADGSLLWLHDVAQLTPGVEGPGRLRGVTMDITERKRVERLLRAIHDGTAATTGGAFLQALVKNLALALDVRYAFVGEFVGTQRDRARILAFWNGEGYTEPFEYPLGGTPCSVVGADSECLVREHVQQAFPQDRDLVAAGAECYFGIRLHSSAGAPTGLLTIMDVKPFADEATARSVMRIFAARAGAEIERIRAAAALTESEQALRESEECFRGLTELSSDWHWEQNEQFRFVALSAGVEQRAGIAVAGHLGKTRWELPAVGVAEEQWAAHRAALEAHLPFHDFEYARTNDKDELVWVRVSGAPIFDEHGAFRGYRGVGKNVTKYKRARRALRESEERFRKLVEFSPDAMYAHSEGRIVLANQAAARLLRAEQPEQLIGREVLDVIAPEFHDRVSARIAQLYEGSRGTPLVEQEYLRLDGTRVSVEVSAAPFTYAGRPAAQVVVRDITERKRAEQALRESEQRQQFALAASRLALWDCNLASGAFYLSEIWSELLGGPHVPTATTFRALAALVPAEDRPRIMAVLIPVLKGLRASYRIEHRVRKPDGETLWIASEGKVIERGADGRALRMIGTNRDITERKRAEQTLRESEERFRSLTELSSDWYWEQDEQFRFVSMSAGAEQRVGIAVAAHLGKTRWELPAVGVTEDEWAAHRAALEAHLPFHDFEYARTNDKGELVWRRISGAPVFDAYGKFRGYRGVGKNVTKYKRARRALHESEGRFRKLVDLSPDATWVHCDGRIVLANQAAARLFRAERPEQLLGLEILELTPPEFRGQVRKRIAQLYAGQAVPLVEREFLRLDGTRVSVEISAAPFVYDGHPASQVVVRDITERKLTEQALALKTAVLHDTFEHMDQGISIINADLKIVGWNRRCLELLDLPESLVNERTTLADVFRFNARRGEYGPGDVEEQVRQRFELVQPHLTERERPGGTILEIRGVSLPGGGFVTTYTDVTERKRAEATLRESEERYRQLVNSSPDAILLLVDQRVTFANPAALHLFGAKAPDELIGREPSEYVAPAYHELSRKRFAAIDAGAEAMPVMEWEYVRLDGGIVPVEAAIRRVTIGGQSAVQVVARDITERKRTEQALRESEERFRKLIDLSPDATYVHYDGRIVLANQAAARLFRAERPEQLLGREVLDVIAPEFHDRVSARIAQLYAGQIMPIIEQEYLRLDGTRVSVEVSSAPFAYDGRPASQVVVRDITERKKAESEVQHVSDLLRGSIDALGEAFVIYDPQDRLVLCNDKYREVYSEVAHLMVPGAQFEDIIRAGAEMGRYVAAIGRVDEWVAERLAIHLAANTTLIQKHSNGRTLRIAERKLPDGHIVGFRIDITESLRAEGRLARLGRILDNSSNEIYVFDAGTLHFVQVNRGARRNLAYAMEELKTLTPLDLKPRFTRRSLEDMLAPLRRRERDMVTFETVHKRKDASLYPVEVRLHFSHTETPPVFVAIVQDITERKRTEAVLRESEERFQHAVRGSLAGIWDWNITAGTYYMSPRFKEILGYSDAEVVNEREFFLSRIHPEDHPSVDAARLRHFEERVPYAIDFRMRRKDGGYIWCRTIGHAEWDASGRVVRYSGSISDIDAQRQAEAQILKLNAELEERVAERTRQLEAANKELEAFSYSVSHDLRAPLRGIDGFSQMLLAKYAGQLDETASDYLHRIRRASLRMGELIDDLLQLSHVSRSRIETGRVDLSRLVRSILAALQEREPGRKVITEVRDGVEVSGDPRLLKIALENLLGNAWKFTAKKEHAKIRFEARDEDGEQVILIKDNGAGFNMKYANKLFGAFQRLHGAAEFEGSGIGLATVQRIVNLHGGRVWTDALTGKGATFYFVIPNREAA